MNITIGLQNVARELTVEVAESAEDVSARLQEAIASAGVLKLSDVQGRLIIVPAGALGYAIVDDKPVGRVGFGV